jgi:hypothetical protein
MARGLEKAMSMKQLALVALASLIALSTTGCGRNGAMAFAAGAEVIAATASLAATVADAEAERRREEEAAQARARYDAAMRRYERDLAAYEAQRAAAAATPPQAPVVVVIPPPPPPAE